MSDIRYRISDLQIEILESTSPPKGNRGRSSLGNVLYYLGTRDQLDPAERDERGAIEYALPRDLSFLSQLGNKRKKGSERKGTSQAERGV